MSGTTPSEPRRRRPRNDDKSEQPVTFLPQGNPHARRAYLCAVLGLIPGLGILTGLPAIVWGYLGRRFAKTDPHHPGIGHAVVSMVLGSLEFILNSVGIGLIGNHFGWW